MRSHAKPHQILWNPTRMLHGAGIFTNICTKSPSYVGKYTIHEVYMGIYGLCHPMKKKSKKIPSGNLLHIAIENHHRKFLSFPIEHGPFSSSLCIRLPEGFPHHQIPWATTIFLWFSFLVFLWFTTQFHINTLLIPIKSHYTTIFLWFSSG